MSEQLFLLKRQQTRACKNKLQLAIWEDTLYLDNTYLTEKEFPLLTEQVSEIVKKYNAKFSRCKPCQIFFYQNAFTIEAGDTGDNCFAAWQLTPIKKPF
jgi:hypothetical protein